MAENIDFGKMLDEGMSEESKNKLGIGQTSGLGGSDDKGSMLNKPLSQYSMALMQKSAIDYNNKTGLELTLPDRYNQDPNDGVTIGSVSDIQDPKDLNKYYDYLVANNFGAQETSPKPFTGTFDASIRGTNYERYRENYNYKNLGFSNFLDNESIYNEQGSNFKNYQTTFKAMRKMAMFGVRDSFALGAMNWKYSEYEKAREMERWMNIGSSTKGRFHGFVSNNMVQLGYMTGMISALWAESAAIGLATGGPGGFVRLGKGLHDAGVAAKRMADVAKAIERVRDLAKMKTLSQFKTGVGDKLANIGRMYMPGGQTINFAKNWTAQGGMNSKNVINGITSLYQDIREFSLVRNESDLESGFAYNQILDQEIERYKFENNGELPTGERLQQLQEYAGNVRDRTKYANWAITYMANKTVLSPMFGNKPTSSLFAKTLRIDKYGNRAILRNATNRDVRKGLTNLSGKKAKRGDKIVEVIPNTFRDRILTPKNLYLAPTSFMRAQFHQAIELNIQDVVSQSNVNYYADLWRGDARMGDYLAYMNQRVGDQFSADGFDIFMSGFFMGGMHSLGAQIVSGAGSQTKNLYSRLTDKNYVSKKTEAYKNKRDASLNELKTNFQNFEKYLNDPLTLFDPQVLNHLRVGQIEKSIKTAEENGDAKSVEKLQKDAFFSAVVTAIDTGMIGEFGNYFNELLSHSDADLVAMKSGQLDTTGMSEEQISKLAGEIRENVKASLDNMLGIASTYQSLVKDLKNPYSNTKTPLEAIHHSMWNEALVALTYNHHLIKDAANESIKLHDFFKETIGFEKALASDINILFSGNMMETLTNEIHTLNQEVEQMSDNKDNLTPERLKELEFKEKKLELINNLISSMEILGELYDPKIKDVDLSKQEVKEGAEELTRKDVDKVKKSLVDYLKLIADNSGDTIDHTKMDEAFETLMEYRGNEADKRRAMYNIEILSDAKNFQTYVERQAEAMMIFNEGRVKFAEGWINMINNEKTNQEHIALLEKIIEEEGIFFDPQYLHHIINDGVFLEAVEDGKPIEFFEGEEGSVKQFELKGEKLKRVQDIIREYLKEHTDVELKSDIEGRFKTEKRYTKDTQLDHTAPLSEVDVAVNLDVDSGRKLRNTLVDEYLKHKMSEKEAKKIRALPESERNKKILDIFNSKEFRKFYDETISKNPSDAVKEAFKEFNTDTSRTQQAEQVVVEMTPEESKILNDPKSSQWDKALFLMSRLDVPVHKIKDMWYFKLALSDYASTKDRYTEAEINNIINKLKQKVQEHGSIKDHQQFVDEVIKGDAQLEQFVKDLSEIKEKKWANTFKVSPINEASGVRAIFETIANSKETNGTDPMHRNITDQLRLLGYTLKDVNFFRGKKVVVQKKDPATGEVTSEESTISEVEMMRNILSTGLTREQSTSPMPKESQESIKARTEAEKKLQVEQENLLDSNYAEYIKLLHNYITDRKAKYDAFLKGISSDSMMSERWEDYNLNINNIMRDIESSNTEVGRFYIELMSDIQNSKGKYSLVERAKIEEVLKRIEGEISKRILNSDYFNKASEKAYPEGLPVKVKDKSGNILPGVYIVKGMTGRGMRFIKAGTNGAGKGESIFIDISNEASRNRIIHTNIDPILGISEAFVSENAIEKSKGSLDLLESILETNESELFDMTNLEENSILAINEENELSLNNEIFEEFKNKLKDC